MKGGVAVRRVSSSGASIPQDSPSPGNSDSLTSPPRDPRRDVWEAAFAPGIPFEPCRVAILAPTWLDDSKYQRTAMQSGVSPGLPLLEMCISVALAYSKADDGEGQDLRAAAAWREFTLHWFTAWEPVADRVDAPHSWADLDPNLPHQLGTRYRRCTVRCAAGTNGGTQLAKLAADQSEYEVVTGIGSTSRELDRACKARWPGTASDVVCTPSFLRL